MYAVKGSEFREEAQKIWDLRETRRYLRESLEITIEEGEGTGRWFVAFPSVCLPELCEELWSDKSEMKLEGSGHQIRFYVLDKFAQLENILTGG